MSGHLRGVPVHPAAELFPPLTGRAFEELKADIQQHGLLTPITYLDGEIIDGRNRYRACVELGITPDEDEIDLDVVPDPFAWVISTNLHRRHLSTSQRAMIAGKIAKLKDGRPPKEETAQNCAVSKTEAASQLKVGKGTVDSAKRVIRDGHPDVVKAVERDEIKVSQAEQLVKAVPDKSKQAKIVAGGATAVRAATKAKRKPTASNTAAATHCDDPPRETESEAASLESHVKKLADILTDYRVSFSAIEAEQWDDVPPQCLRRVRMEAETLSTLLSGRG